MKRVFLGWSHPGLVTAVEHLVARYGRPDVLDLSEVIVAVPGGRVARRLLEILLHWADEKGCAFAPPQIVTVGHLPEMLYVNKRPFAEGLVQHLAWMAALRRSDPARLKRLTPALPSENDFGAWMALAEMLERLSRELAAENLSFADVAERGEKMPEFRDAPRWEALAEVQRKYLDTLNDVGVWDKQTARLLAIKFREPRTDCDIVLLGAVDLNHAQRMILDQVSSRVTALVVAPEELADRFDEHGCIRSEAWLDARIPLREEQIEVAEKPADQATAVLKTLAAWGGKYHGEEITIGVPDAAVAPYVQQHLQQVEVAARHAAGMPVVHASPCRLLAVIADYLERRQFTAFAALVRHPAMQDWLAQTGIRGDWLSELDDYYCQHLPHEMDGTWLGPEEECGLIRQADAAINELLQPISQGKRKLDEWAKPLIALLVGVYGKQTLDRALEPDRTILAACDAIHDILEGHRNIPRPLVPSVSGTDALRLILRELHGATIPPLPERGAIELLGWLELPLDDAPAMIVTGFNEGIVPSSLSADLFLPNNLRLQLGIEDNDRRYARDAYALAVLAASREHLKLIVGRRTAEGDPLSPSRLLFACDREAAARRAIALFGSESAAVAPPFAGTLQPGCRRSKFEVPPPSPLPEPVRSMRVTEFRDYLACPYRYYLRHRLRLRSRLDAGEELDGGMFGSLAHAVLDRFGRSKAAASVEADVIAAQLDSLLDELVVEMHGKTPLSAIRVQVEQLRMRLAAFARWQAHWASLGWRIEYVEISAGEREAPLVVAGRTMQLRGRIDRIDIHPKTGQIAVFDYKTADSPRDPERAHRKNGEWIDLQLPLYRHLAKGIGIEGPVCLGYIALPKDTSKTQEVMAQWTDGELAEADHAAEMVIRGIWDERFWPPTTPAPQLFEEFSAICMDGQFGSMFPELDGNEGEIE